MEMMIATPITANAPIRAIRMILLLDRGLRELLSSISVVDSTVGDMVIQKSLVVSHRASRSVVLSVSASVVERSDCTRGYVLSALLLRV